MDAKTMDELLRAKLLPQLNELLKLHNLRNGTSLQLEQCQFGVELVGSNPAISMRIPVGAEIVDRVRHIKYDYVFFKLRNLHNLLPAGLLPNKQQRALLNSLIP